ncbi:MAG: plastocyanin/azurin family copper-binding protein [Gemmatimonadaceae bacterium]
MRACHRIVIGAATLASLSTAGCSGGGGPTSSGSQNPPPSGQPPGQQPPGQQPPSTSTSITVRNNRFDPSSTTINVGTTVTWTWDACSDDGYGGRSCVDHNVTFDGGGAASPTQSDGVFSRLFNAAGTFTYRCTVHGAPMTGQVIVR